MTTVHRLAMAGSCPVDGTLDVYALVVTVEGRVLPVEEILDAVDVATREPAFQEDLTQRIADALGEGVKVETHGRHSNVETTCTAVAAPQ